jgi:hypothetical protein
MWISYSALGRFGFVRNTKGNTNDFKSVDHDFQTAVMHACSFGHSASGQKSRF